MNFAYGTTVIRQRATKVLDPYSGEATDLSWDDPGTLEIPGCAVWQESSLEPDPIDQRRAQVVTVTKVAAPYDVDIEPNDRFVALGSTYEVQGEVQRYRHPMTGWQPGAIVTGRRRDG